jgi:hypothetical protein
MYLRGLTLMYRLAAGNTIHPDFGADVAVAAAFILRCTSLTILPALVHSARLLDDAAPFLPHNVCAFDSSSRSSRSSSRVPAVLSLCRQCDEELQTAQKQVLILCQDQRSAAAQFQQQLQEMQQIQRQLLQVAARQEVVQKTVQDLQQAVNRCILHQSMQQRHRRSQFQYDHEMERLKQQMQPAQCEADRNSDEAKRLTQLALASQVWALQLVQKQGQLKHINSLNKSEELQLRWTCCASSAVQSIRLLLQTMEVHPMPPGEYQTFSATCAVKPWHMLHILLNLTKHAIGMLWYGSPCQSHTRTCYTTAVSCTQRCVLRLLLLVCIPASWQAETLFLLGC